MKIKSQDGTKEMEISDPDNVKLLNMNIECATEHEDLDALVAFKDELFHLFMKYKYIPLSLAIFEVMDPKDAKPDDVLVDSPFERPENIAGGYVSPELLGGKSKGKLN